MSTYSPIIEVIEEAYYIAEFNTTRKISALLPYDYYESKHYYPVLYLQDGQNLFNPNAPFGDWAIDKSLAKLAEEGYKDIVIIAVDHGDDKRIKEYLPYRHARYGKGQGKSYIDFMRKKLIPYVKEKYRVLTDYADVGIGGSSMGGLISLYGGLAYPAIFGKMMIFSPSLWIANKIYRKARNFAPLPDTKIYFYSGGQESKTHLANVRRLETIFREKIEDDAYFDMEVEINMAGQHSEIYWAQEFPKALKWLFYDK
ncbi:alpha/beta hydrolase [Portibacter marinus]|uniref:alpha/beta hydrolase n=1 Tax=Portibacter marinus TaxID=2898660 RepID=UPI001EEA9D49|nr:alpha/beta hydrolase-fold protein [Portibacter marinus]